MPITIEQALAVEVPKPLDIPFGDASMHIEYMLGKVTSEAVAIYRERIAEADDNKKNVREAEADFLASLLVAWDLTAGEGQPPIPCTKEGIHSVPSAIVSRIMGAIFDDVRPLPQKKETSPAG